MNNFSKLQKNLGLVFRDEKILHQALIHRSYLNEHSECSLPHNERLEFLGDAVLEIGVTEYLYINYPQTPEGDLTNWRASLVNAKMLYQIAADLGIEDFLFLSKGEARDKNTKARQYILANAMEAIIGAIYLDQGMDVAKDFIERKVLSHLDEILSSGSYVDPKSRFQEIAQEKEGVTPVYKSIKEEGPDHDKIFTVGLYLKEDLITTGTGSSKQEAQVEAASIGLKVKGWS
jgi:ribonuclease-3